jgi:3-dehydroquinate synthetase
MNCVDTMTARGDYTITFGNISFPYYLRQQHAWLDMLARLEALQADHFFIVTDEAFPSSLAKQFREQVATLGLPADVLVISANEQSKSLHAVDTLSEKAVMAGMTRASCVIALGGGLVGNIAGLWAALQYRSVRLVHVPTTLLAMSDSVLSLKQAVNTRQGKNHIGTFYKPQFIWTDLSYLESLPAREVQAALCELIKNVVGICPDLYDNVSEAINPEARYSPETYQAFIEWCIDAKCSVMHDDAHEKHEALILEYGHTVGHAIELLSSYLHPAEHIPHGIAVGLGMLVEAEISHRLGYLSRSDVEVHRNLLKRNGVPTTISLLYSSHDILNVIKHDNKRGYFPEQDRMRPLILLDGLGKPHRTGDSLLTFVPDEVILAGIEAVR